MNLRVSLMPPKSSTRSAYPTGPRAPAAMSAGLLGKHAGGRLHPMRQLRDQAYRGVAALHRWQLAPVGLNASGHPKDIRAREAPCLGEESITRDGLKHEVKSRMLPKN